MSYQRAYPRDLFNESKLLKCLGQLCLLIHEGKASGLKMPREVGVSHRIELDIYNNALYCDNLKFFTVNDYLLNLSIPYNSRDPYPLVCDDTVNVFTNAGELAPEFIQYLQDYEGEAVPEFEVGDSVIAPEPNETDDYTYGGWVGCIVLMQGTNAVVEDVDGDCFEIEITRLKPAIR